MRKLIEYIARGLVDQPDLVEVREGRSDRYFTAYHLTVASGDFGKVRNWIIDAENFDKTAVSRRPCVGGDDAICRRAFFTKAHEANFYHAKNALRANKIKYVREGRSDRYFTAYHLTVASGDFGKVVGRQGRVAKAVRSLVRTAAARQGKHISLEIHEYQADEEPQA